MEKTLAPKPSPTPAKSGSAASTEVRQAFFGAALNMSWQLAIVVLLPIIAGAKVDQHFNTAPAWTIVGFVVAMAGTGLVMWRALQLANRLPVPKLTAAQKRAIQKQYEEDDD